MKDKSKEIYQYVLGAVIVLAAFGYGLSLVRWEVPAGSKDAVMLAAGVLLALATSVVNYFFGSSKSSADKDKTIAGKQSESSATITNKP
ncbi:MAG: hypothetical protein M1587_09655 [Thaumarchaeota archaeon]|nr:hypothetical protein [Nitrososphaerota archaeon]